jgi:BirA family biotin operon repressor/biotin-[acetyl-CoA-carboxylase] ligase
MGKRWIKLDKVSSTNSYISTLLSQDDTVDPIVVLADYQEAGRGQGSHSWHSRQGENLLMSLLLFPAFLSASSQFCLSMAASLAITDTLHPLGIRTEIKWPNDILTKKGKIAGILIEHGIAGKRISYSIIGLGLNLNQLTFPEFPVPATSVMLETEKHTTPEDLARNLVQNLEARYDILEQGGSQAIKQDYLKRLYLMNQTASFRAGEETFEGEIQGVSEVGELQVKKAGQLKTYSHGEIVVTSTQ